MMLVDSYSLLLRGHVFLLLLVVIMILLAVLPTKYTDCAYIFDSVIFPLIYACLQKGLLGYLKANPYFVLCMA